MTLIDVAIGLIFIYLLIALMCSVLQELIANFTNWRGKNLRNAIKTMLNDPTMTGLAQRLYRHPRVAALSPRGELPSYIPGATFARTLADIVVDDNNFHPSVDGPLAPFIRAASGSVDKLEAEFAQWFEDSMDRLSGWYKRNVQVVLFILGLAVAAGFNVNSLEIARVLWTQPLLRDAIVQNAGKFYLEGQPNQQDSQVRLSKLQEGVNDLHLPIGWDRYTVACLFQREQERAACRGSMSEISLPWVWLVQVAGWLITALAASLGTQFWFQTLGEALSLRAAGVRPPKAAGKASAEAGSGG
jgi:hypothetical protein